MTIRRMYRRYEHPAGPTPPTDYVRRWINRVLDGERPADSPIPRRKGKP